MSNRDSSKKILLSVIGISILIIAVVGVAFAFFNYIRTGSSNVVKVGRIYFNSEQGNTINLTNVFPIDKTKVNTDTDNVGSVSIHISGDTTYDNGVEYLVTAVNVNNSSSSGNRLPINISVDYSESENKDIGTPDAEYFTNRGGNASRYKVLAEHTIENNDQLLVGYIAKGSTGIDGTITIKAFLDKDRIAITDTYPPVDKSETIPSQYEYNSEVTQGDIDSCVTYLSYMSSYLRGEETLEGFCRGEDTIYNLDLIEWIKRSQISSSEMINRNIIIRTFEGYTKRWTNGTTNEWVDDRRVFTTTEWNSLQENGISFAIKVEANEGIWVEERLTENDLDLNSLRGAVYNAGIDTRNIKEVHFVRMDEDTINTHDDAINVTLSSGVGLVKTWYETTNDDKYIYYIASPGETYLPVDSNNAFNAFVSVERIIFENINTSNVIDMSAMFKDCVNLVSLDLSSFDTSNVQRMISMFYHCNSLTSLDFSNQGNDNLLSVEYMFFESANIEEINMSGFNFGRSIMSHAFRRMPKLVSIDLTNANTSQVVAMVYTFDGCTSLEELDLSSLDTHNVQFMTGTFQSCTSLTKLNLDNQGGDNLQSITYIVSGCTNLEELSMSNFNFGLVTGLNNSDFCKNLANLRIVDLSNAKTSNVTSIENMFYGCSNLETVDFSGVDFTKVTNMVNMFFRCGSLTTIYVSNSWNDNIEAWDTGSVVSHGMFYECESLVGGALTTFDENHIDREYARIDGGSTNPGYLTLKTA